jgi:integrase
MRKGEILGLKWSQIKDGLIYLDGKDTKTKESRQLPVNVDLAELFREIRAEEGLRSEFVFTYQSNRIKDVKTGFKGALRRARIDDFKFHDLRHTAASQMVIKGATLREVQEILGHSNIPMTMRYAHSTEEKKREAVNRLSGLTGRHKKSQKAILAS